MTLTIALKMHLHGIKKTPQNTKLLDIHASEAWNSQEKTQTSSQKLTQHALHLNALVFADAHAGIVVDILHHLAVDQVKHRCVLQAFRWPEHLQIGILITMMWSQYSYKYTKVFSRFLLLLCPWSPHLAQVFQQPEEHLYRQVIDNASDSCAT